MAARKKAAGKKTATKEKNLGGRPTLYTPELGDLICERLSRGESLLKISRDAGMPHRNVMANWVIGVGGPKDDELRRFQGNYERSRKMQADHYFEEIGEIADGADSQFNSKERLQVDSRKWIIARMNRAKYGEKADINLGGQSGSPPVQTQTVDVSSLSDEERKQLKLLAQKLITRGTT